MDGRLKNGKSYIGFLAIVIVLSLGFLGVGYGNWNNHTQLDYTFNMGEFEPEIEVYKVHRCWGAYDWWPTDFYFSNAITPNNSKLTINIGEQSNAHIPESAVEKDQYTIYFRVTNNSSIPIKYKTIKSPSLTNTEKQGVEVYQHQNEEWITLLPGESEDDNYAYINLRNQYFSQAALGNTNFKKYFARIKLRQFNISDDSGWKEDVDIGVDIDKFIAVRI